jgi:hypothetical protein
MPICTLRTHTVAGSAALLETRTQELANPKIVYGAPIIAIWALPIGYCYELPFLFAEHPKQAGALRVAPSMKSNLIGIKGQIRKIYEVVAVLSQGLD